MRASGIAVLFFLMDLAVIAQPKDIKKLKRDFAKAKNDSLFVACNSVEPFREIFFNSHDLEHAGQEFLDAPVGAVMGPYYRDAGNEYYYIYKVLQRDSLMKMRASHLYVSPAGFSADDTARAFEIVDSLYQAVKNGGNFAELARMYNDDATTATGGDLGWVYENMLAKPMIEAIMKSKKGDLLKVRTIYGWHVILVTEQARKDLSGMTVIYIKRRNE